jgi:hypothetical protein
MAARTSSGKLGIHLQVQARPRIKVVIQPGPEHITDAQKVRLRDRSMRWLSWRRPQAHPEAARHRVVGLTGKQKVTSYHLIPASAQAEAYLQTCSA